MKPSVLNATDMGYVGTESSFPLDSNFDPVQLNTTILVLCTTHTLMIGCRVGLFEPALEPDRVECWELNGVIAAAKSSTDPLESLIV